MKRLARLLLIIGFSAVATGYFPSAALAACLPSTGSKSFSYGSSVAAGSVTICGQSSTSSLTVKAKSTTTKNNTAKSTASSVTKSVVKSVPTPVGTVKPGCPPSTLNTADIIIAASMGCVIYGYTTPSVTLKTVESTKATFQAAPVASNNSADISFSPNTVSISASTLSAEVNQAIIFSSNAGQHVRSGTILGQAAEVRFTPISQSWNFADGATATGAVHSHAFGTAASHEVSLVVGYEVAYRFAPQINWTIESSISVSANTTVNISKAVSSQVVTSIAAPSNQPKPHLVSANCIARPSTYRCSP